MARAARALAGRYTVRAIVGLQATVIASRAPHLLLEQSVMTIQRIVNVHRPLMRIASKRAARSTRAILVFIQLVVRSFASLTYCRLITYWPARSIFISGAGPVNSHIASMIEDAARDGPCAHGNTGLNSGHVARR